MRRREFLAGAAGIALGPSFWRGALHADARAAASSYGPLGAPDANGLRLPPRFTSRLIARANRLVAGTSYPWHPFPDGQATFATSDGGWVLVSNSESLAPTGAGSSAIRFRRNGTIADAYRILAGTNANCAGGGTPWGRWLSCEEHDYGHVWERTGPTGASTASGPTVPRTCARDGWRWPCRRPPAGWRSRPCRTRAPSSRRRGGRSRACAPSTAARASGTTAGPSTSRRRATTACGPTTPRPGRCRRSTTRRRPAR